MGAAAGAVGSTVAVPMAVNLEAAGAEPQASESREVADLAVGWEAEQEAAAVMKRAALGLGAAAVEGKGARAVAAKVMAAEETAEVVCLERAAPTGAVASGSTGAEKVAAAM